VNRINGQFGNTCVEFDPKAVKINTRSKSWTMSMIPIRSHQDLLVSLDLSAPFLLSGIPRGFYYPNASARSQAVSDLRLHPTHEWFLISIDGGPMVQTSLSDFKLTEEFQSQNDATIFRRNCFDGFVQKITRSHFAHILVGVGLEQASDHSSAVAALKNLIDAGEMTTERLEKIRVLLTEAEATYPVALQVIDSSIPGLHTINTSDLIRNIEQLKSSANTDNAKVSQVTLTSYPTDFPAVTQSLTAATSVLATLSEQYTTQLTYLDLISYIADGGYQYKPSELVTKASNTLDQIESNLQKLRVSHRACSELSDDCTVPQLNTFDEAGLRAMKPILITNARRPQCGVERYKLGVGDVCKKVGPVIYKLAESPACGVKSYKKANSEYCGIKSYKLAANIKCGLEALPATGFKKCQIPENGVESFFECRDEHHGNESYFACRVPENGVDIQPCRDASFGDELYKSCSL
jgi:hypothetical protein